MALFSRLLDAPEGERDAELSTLLRTDPALHARVLRLLGTAGRETGALAGPLQAAIRVALGEGVDHAPCATPGSSIYGQGGLIAGYRLLRLLGQGGMSAVWLAERADGQLKRPVAIKLPLAAQLSGLLAERFARERDVLAALDHPHIARLIDAGVTDSALGLQPYIVLEHVEGVPITEYAAAASVRDKLLIFLQVLEAVDHAHRHLAVHRDLKPSNILVDTHGQVKLLDFGIAKLLALPPDAAALTQEAGGVMTPRYAAPEQVQGAAVSTATDVYSAAVVLYEWLTGHMPYGSVDDGIAQWMHAVADSEARVPGLTQDTDTVLLKALRKAPEDRYASIERFAEDIRRLLDDRPILARRVPWWHRARLLVRRHRMLSTAATLGSVALAVAAGLAWQQSQEAGAQRQRAAAVRNFVFTMVGDAEPAQGRNEVTGREMIDAAVARARKDFAADPRLRGELLAELGRVYFRLRQTEAAVATLQESVDLMERVAPRDDPPYNRGRAVLAEALLRSDAERATKLAQQALTDCSREGAPCAQARALAHYALAAAASWHGQHPQALTHARAMAAESELAQTADPTSLSLALETLATTARNQGELTEADAAIQRAQAIAARRSMKALERARLNLMQSAIDIDLGRYAPARDRLAALTSTNDAPSERSLQWRMLASAELGLRRADAALAAAGQAQAFGSAGAEAWFARPAWGQAASLAGQTAAGIAALAEARDGLVAAGFPATSASMLRVRRLHTEAQLRAGSPADAGAALKALRAEHEALAAPHRVEWGLTLDALGCAAALAGQTEAARGHYAAADERYDTLLPTGHPLRLRNAALRALIEGDASTALARWRDTLAVDSAWRQRAVVDCRTLI